VRSRGALPFNCPTPYAGCRPGAAVINLFDGSHNVMYEIQINSVKYPVDLMYDLDGDETDDPFLAISVVCPMPNGTWLAVEVKEGEVKLAS
jgi:hypothetical protein